MNKPGILLVGNFLSLNTGTRSVCEELSLHLSEKGWKTIETSHQTKRIFRLIDMMYAIIFFRKEYQITYVEVYSGLAFFWAEWAVQLLTCLHKPIILALHGGGLIEFNQKHPKRISKLLTKCQIIVTPSLFLQNGLKPYNSNIRYLPNAVDVTQYKFKIRSHLAPKLVWLRAFHEIYQPKLAIRVLALLQRKYEGIILIMIGPNKKDSSLSSTLKLAKNLGLASHINIVGPIQKSEVPVWLAKGDIFLNTTRYESFGISVIEAALIGLPIVTTNVGELSYLWENEKTAMLVPQSEPEAIANAVKRILTEPKLAKRLSKNARKKAEQFDWTVILPQWEDMFFEIIKNEEIRR